MTGTHGSKTTKAILYLRQKVTWHKVYQLREEIPRTKRKKQQKGRPPQAREGKEPWSRVPFSQETDIISHELIRFDPCHHLRACITGLFRQRHPSPQNHPWTTLTSTIILSVHPLHPHQGNNQHRLNPKGPLPFLRLPLLPPMTKGTQETWQRLRRKHCLFLLLSQKEDSPHMLISN